MVIQSRLNDDLWEVHCCEDLSGGPWLALEIGDDLLVTIECKAFNRYRVDILDDLDPVVEVEFTGDLDEMKQIGFDMALAYVIHDAMSKL